MTILAITREKEDFQSHLGIASLIYSSQLKGGFYKDVHFWDTLTPGFNHYAFEIKPEIHEIIKLELMI